MSEIIDTQFTDSDKKPNVKDIIIIKQLPVMEERFQEINAEILDRLSALDELEVSEDTKTAVKKTLADFRKEFAEFEERRKQVKNEINKPYDNMNALYGVYIEKPYKNAFNKLSVKITDIEDKQKDKMLSEAQRFYNEYRESIGLTFTEYDQSRFKTNLTTTMKNLKEQIRHFLDGVKKDIESINTFGEHADDIMLEYKRTLDLSSAIKIINDRIQAKAQYEAEKARAAEIAEQQKQAEAKVDEAVKRTESEQEQFEKGGEERGIFDHEKQKTCKWFGDKRCPVNSGANCDACDMYVDCGEDEPEIKPAQEVTPAATEENDKIYTVSFKVRGTKARLKKVKEFLINGGYEYE